MKNIFTRKTPIADAPRLPFWNASRFLLSVWVVVLAAAAPASHPPCPADFDCSGTLDANDIFAFLAAWFAGSPSANSNGVNGLEVQDVLAFGNGWFGGC